MRYNSVRINMISEKYLRTIKVMYNCRKQNANKNMKLQI